MTCVNELDLIAVLYGGFSKEKEVSLETGKNVYEGLISLGYKAELFEVNEDFGKKILEIRPDFAFICLHGRLGEDGTVQGMLEFLKIPYSGCGIFASSAGINKKLTKKLLSPLGIVDFLPDLIIDRFDKDLNETIQKTVGYPFIAKPVCEGSSIGIEIINSVDELEVKINKALESKDTLLIEPFIQGSEFTCGIIGNCGRMEVLPLIRIKPVKGYFDYKNKYTKGCTEYEIPGEISPDLEMKIVEFCRSAFEFLEMKGAVRMDFIVEEKQKKVWFLEYNTIPGMTPTSLIPMSAEKSGLSFGDVLKKIIEYS